MRTISIIVKEMKQHLRDKTYMISMILFPIFLTAILGSATGGDLENEIVFNSKPVIYYIEGQGKTSKAFETMIKELNNIDKKEIYSFEEGIEQIKNNKFSAYIHLKVNEDKIIIYKNENYNIEGSLMELVLNSFVERFNILIEINKVTNENLVKVSEVSKAESHNYVEVKSLDKLKGPSAKDYYGIMMLLMMVMYCAMGGMSIINTERYRKTLDRLIIAPINRLNLFIAMTIGAFIVNCIQFTIVISVLKYLFNINFGEDFISVILIIASLGILAISIGCAMSLMIPGEKCQGILNILLVLLCFLGGSYMSIESLNSEFLMKLANVSPVRWTNNSIFSVIYANDYSKFYSTLALNFGIAAILFLISMMLFKRMED
ncbi:ABC transporter permease [Clostridium sp.]|uniref:ABC transporter permease n=1 Tax=Clostridium sp. TaxID=1506 RepID=UPI000EF0FE84|nr:ABC transporter permease [Clostridium sp.]HCQ91525.1 hypothetical protein [Clostridium sp.]